MKRLYLVTILLLSSFLYFSCTAPVPTDEEASEKTTKKETDENSEESDTDENEDKAKVGSLAISVDDIDTSLKAAQDDYESVGTGFVPDSMKPGGLAISTELALLNSPPIFCTQNPSHQMCQDCGPGGSLSGTQECVDFFSPGGDGYIAGEYDNTDGSGGTGDSGGSDGSQQMGDNQDGGGQDDGQDDPDNPCAGVSFLNCQPRLVKLYLKMANDSVNDVKSVLTELRSAAKNIEDEKGALAIGHGEKLLYEITSESEMRFIVTEGGKARQFFKIDGNEYTYRTKFGSGGFYTKLVKEEDSWEVETRMVTGDCNPNDFRAPRNIRILVKKSEGVWNGKAMMYLPRWRGESCNDTPSEEVSMNIYTAFVGEKDYSTASLYMMKESVSSLGENTIGDYGINKFCSNFPGMCYNGNAFGDAIPSNPFCSKKDGSVVWGGACSDAIEAKVKQASYDLTLAWQDPSEVLKELKNLPDAIKDAE